MTRRILRAVAVALAALWLAGCCQTRTREVFVRIPAPPPSVVVQTDTVRTAAPDTVFVPWELRVPGPTRLVVHRDTVYRTRPAVVVRYATPRASVGFVLAGLDVSTDTVRIAGAQRDWLFAAPRPGETLAVQTLGPDSLAAAVTGRPRATTARGTTEVTCPDGRPSVQPPTPLVPGGWRGGLKLTVLLALAALAGAVFAALGLLLIRR